MREYTTCSIEGKLNVDFVKKNRAWLLPIVLLLCITPFLNNLDLEIASLTYNSAQRSFSNNFFYDLMFRFGCVPAQAVCGIAALLFLLSYFYPRFIPTRSITLAISLTMIIGAGLLTHTFFKENWGRPRPRQIEQFGGKQQFRPYYSPALTRPETPSKSFPSGHSTCGFYFFILYFIGKRLQNRTLKMFGLFLGSILGLLLSMARIMQGGHFLSDTLFACFLMWETSYFVDWLVFEYQIIAQKAA
jgi:lipid A 4'-phosphatase